MFDTTPFLEVVQSAQLVVFDQCMFGGTTKKPTMLLHDGVDLSGIQVECTHGPGAHPQCVQSRIDGDFATAMLAKYPADLNKFLAFAIKRAVQGCVSSLIVIMFSGLESRLDGLPAF